MIAFVHMAYEYEGESWSFLDFEDLSDEVVNTILEIRNRYREQGDDSFGDSPWEIEARFPEGEAQNLGHWTGFLGPSISSPTAGGGYEYPVNKEILVKRSARRPSTRASSPRMRSTSCRSSF